MPRETPSHQTVTRTLDENYAVEYDHDNGYLAIILLPSSRINMIPQTVQALSDFLNAMDVSVYSSEELSLEYTASYTYGLLVLRKGAMRVPFSVQATQALREFLEKELGRQEATAMAITSIATIYGWLNCKSCDIWTNQVICPHCNNESGAKETNG